MTVQPLVLGSQDGNVWVPNKDGQIRWKFPAGSWVNGVGVSRDGSVIVAGAIDGTVYILDKDGTLLTRTKTESAIQQRSVAVSGDGMRIVVVDESTMYGYNLVGIPEVTYTETLVQTNLCPCAIASQVPVKTTLPISVLTSKVTTPPETTSTPKSALTSFLSIIAFAGLLFIVMRRNN